MKWKMERQYKNGIGKYKLSTNMNRCSLLMKEKQIKTPMRQHQTPPERLKLKTGNRQCQQGYVARVTLMVSPSVNWYNHSEKKFTMVEEMHTLWSSNSTCRYLCSRHPCATIPDNMCKNTAFLQGILKIFETITTLQKSFDFKELFFLKHL